ncbi:MAG: hypothetical protein L3J84_13295, partial [Gammaproteobacteria bacterium]|nr:hypothetical protein [Gammaproteobacteria bacterium]
MRRFSLRPLHPSRHCSRCRKAMIYVSLPGLALLVLSSVAHSESLMDVYNLAADNDPVIRQANANHAAAREALPQSRANFLPSIDF